MDKSYLEECLGRATHSYVWTLYFFSSHKQRNAGYSYEGHKVRFTKNTDLISYAQNLVASVCKYQLDPITEVAEYDGLNTKCSCDRLCVNDALLKTNFDSFWDSLVHSTFADVKSSYKGYALEGQPGANSDGLPITFLKFANPTAKLGGRKSTYFKKSENSSLDEITEQFYRMYLTVDAVLIDDQLYNFTHKFEEFFDVEQTMHRVKQQAIKAITDAGFIADVDKFSEHAQSTHARTFITLKDERIQRAALLENRQVIAGDLGIPLDSSDLFDVSEQEQANRLIKYLCYKVFKESETNELLEASSVSKMVVDETAMAGR